MKKPAVTLLPGQLGTLEAAGLIRLATIQPELEYLFRHTLVHEAAYTSLVKQDRRRLHNAVGEALERLYPGELEKLAPHLGRHFAEAGEDEKAIEYFTMAGDTAARGYANAEAVMHYSSALHIAKKNRHLQDFSTRIHDIFSRKGQALERSGQFREALANYIDMDQTAQETGNRSMQLAAMISRLVIHSIPSQVYDEDRARPLAEQALELAQELDDLPARAKILWCMLILSFFTNHPEQALEYGEESLAIARKLNLREQMAYTLNDLAGYIFSSAGQVEKSQAALAEARSIWRELNHIPMLTDNLTNSAFLYFFIGDFEKAEELVNESYQLSSTIHNIWGESFSLGIRGQIFLEKGEIGRALQDFQTSYQKGDEGGFYAGRIIARCMQATLYEYLGDYQSGMEIAQEAVTKAGKDAPFWLSSAIGCVALIHTQLGQLEQAEELVNRVHATDAPLDVLLYGFTVPRAEFELFLRKGEFDRVIELGERYLRDLQSRNISVFTPYILYFKAKALLGKNLIEDAHQVMLEANAMAATIPMRKIWWPILASLAEIESRKNNPSLAQQHRSKAKEIIGYIRDQISSPTLRASFINQPNVRALLGSSPSE